MPWTGRAGSRVSLRYRLPDGFTDVVGHLESVTPIVLVRTKSGELVEITPDNVVSVRELSHVPVRNSEIRAVEHAAALAWPSTEQHWVDGWLLRAGGAGLGSNSAVPLLFSSDLTALPAIVDWYAARGLPPWLALPERLLPVRGAGVEPNRILTRELPDSSSDAQPQIAGRVAVTTAPDGTVWAGLSEIVADTNCAELLAWASAQGATRAHVRIPDEDTAATTLTESMGFRLHHRARYLRADSL